MSTQAEVASGFTLVELIIVMVVAAILVVAAVPGWRLYQWRAGRIEGTEALLDVAVAQERHFSRVHRYASSLELAPPDGLGLSPTTPQGRYRIRLSTAADGLGYETVATAVGSQSGDAACAMISIDETGRRRLGAAECWVR